MLPLVLQDVIGSYLHNLRLADVHIELQFCMYMIGYHRFQISQRSRFEHQVQRYSEGLRRNVTRPTQLGRDMSQFYYESSRCILSQPAWCAKSYGRVLERVPIWPDHPCNSQRQYNKTKRYHFKFYNNRK